MSTGCAVCDGTLSPMVVSVTGNHVETERVRYGETDYFVHGANYCNGATTWWLAPAEACGE